jgi:SulP family sulfate permease
VRHSGVLIKRYRDALSSVHATLGHGLKSRLRRGYGKDDLTGDLMASLVVGVVALPLSMALAIASGVPPEHGLYTAIVAGTVCALLGGTQFQVTGPTAAFVVLLVPVVSKFGLGGLLVAGCLSGLIQIAMGLARLGRLMIFIPHPVTTGFTAGIAVVIGTTQLKDFFGLQLSGTPESYVERVRGLWEARGSASPWELGIGLFTLALLVLLPRITKRVPAPLIALTAAAGVATLLGHFIGDFHVATIGSRFHSVVNGHVVDGIPPLPPMPMLPWHMTGANGAPMVLSFETIRMLMPSAFGIAMLGSIESLLSAVVADGMAGTKHDPNAELLALGIGNVLCPFFGGIPATGALARTATNIKAGARSPLAAVFHAGFVLASTVVLAPLVGYLPMAALAALLLVVAKNMSEYRHFSHLVRVAPRSDVVVLVTCFGLTVAFDMVLAVSVGVVMAALLFMRRMSELTNISLDTDLSRDYPIPEGVVVYEIGGPLFFGAAQKAMSVLDTVQRRHGAVILVMAKVPVIDATGLVALETLLAGIKRAGQKVILCGVGAAPRAVLERAGIVRQRGVLSYAPDFDTAVSMGIVHSARNHDEPLTPDPDAVAPAAR